MWCELSKSHVRSLVQTDSARCRGVINKCASSKNISRSLLVTPNQWQPMDTKFESLNRKIQQNDLRQIGFSHLLWHPAGKRSGVILKVKDKREVNNKGKYKQEKKASYRYKKSRIKTKWVIRESHHLYSYSYRNCNFIMLISIYIYFTECYCSGSLLRLWNRNIHIFTVDRNKSWQLFKLLIFQCKHKLMKKTETNTNTKQHKMTHHYRSNLV